MKWRLFNIQKTWARQGHFLWRTDIWMEILTQIIYGIQSDRGVHVEHFPHCVVFHSQIVHTFQYRLLFDFSLAFLTDKLYKEFNNTRWKTKEFYQSLLGYEFVWIYINSIVKNGACWNALFWSMFILVFFFVFCFTMNLPSRQELGHNSILVRLVSRRPWFLRTKWHKTLTYVLCNWWGIW